MFHNGRKGRPIRKPVSKLKLLEPPETIMPHLHIIIVYTEQEKRISNKLVESITKKYGVESSRAYDITNRNPIYFLQYAIRQSATFRFVDDYTNTIDFDLKKMSKVLTKQKEGLYFHNNNRNDSRFRLPAA